MEKSRRSAKAEAAFAYVQKQEPRKRSRPPASPSVATRADEAIMAIDPSSKARSRMGPVAQTTAMAATIA